MTDDLVQRLRRTYLKEYAPTGSMVGDISNRLRPFPILATKVLFNPDGREAADRIETLQADNARLRLWLYHTINLAEIYAEGTGTIFKDGMAEARAALQETSDDRDHTG